MFISFFGMVVILGLLAKFGIPVLADVSFFLFGEKDGQQEIVKKDVFIPPPVFDAIPNATNRATITISGSASENQKVMLYVNGTVNDTTDTEEDGSFTFEDASLEEGENLIQAKVANKDKEKQESDFSVSHMVIFKKSAPSLAIDSPSPNQTFSKDDTFTNVRGKTDIGVKVTINDFWAIVDSDGVFSYNLPLKDGENKIKIVGLDEAENKTEKEIIVTRSQ